VPSIVLNQRGVPSAITITSPSATFRTWPLAIAVLLDQIGR
jgi:hypothetical protein